MKADFNISSGALKLADANPKRFPYVVVSGTGGTRSLQTQHKQLETACTRAQELVRASAQNVAIVDRRTGELWSHAFIMGYNQ